MLDLHFNELPRCPQRRGPSNEAKSFTASTHFYGIRGENSPPAKNEEYRAIAHRGRITVAVSLGCRNRHKPRIEHKLRGSYIFPNKFQSQEDSIGVKLDVTEYRSKALCQGCRHVVSIPQESVLPASSKAGSARAICF